MEFEMIPRDLITLLYQECTCCLRYMRDICFTCTECTDFKLCLQCYISQVELGKHKATHVFNATDLATFPLFGNPSANKQPENTVQSDSPPSSGEFSTPTKSRKCKRLKTTHSHSFEYEMDFNCLGMLQDKLVMNPNTSSKIPYVWRACDERDFMSAVQLNSFGNWEGIQEELKNRKINVSVREVMEHYFIHYVLTDLGPVTIPWHQKASELKEMFDNMKKKQLQN